MRKGGGGVISMGPEREGINGGGGGGGKRMEGISMREGKERK